MALGGRNACNGSGGRAGTGAQGSGGTAVGGYGVGDRGLVEGVGAVVVADEDVGVDVAEADEVVTVLLAGVDAGLVAGDTGVNDAGGMLVWGAVCLFVCLKWLCNDGKSVWTINMRSLVIALSNRDIEMVL
jgi:hypothetical protein